MKAFSEEVNKIQKLIINDNELIKKYVMKHKPKQYGRIYNLEGSVMNHVLCGIENDCLQSLVSFLNANDFNVNVLCFDGCMTIKKELSEEQEKEFIEKAEEYVFSQTSYKMKIVRKPLTNVFNIPDNIVKVIGKNGIIVIAYNTCAITIPRKIHKIHIPTLL